MTELIEKGQENGEMSLTVYLERILWVLAGRRLVAGFLVAVRPIPDSGASVSNSELLRDIEMKSGV